MHILVMTLIAAVLAIISTVAVIPMSYAAPVPAVVPAECQTYVDQPSEDHGITVLTPGPYLPGQSIDVSAGTTDTGTGVNRVRIVAVVDDSTVIHNQLLVLPTPYGSVSDTIVIPADTPPHSNLDIYACFESPGTLNGAGVTHHLDVGSIFVIPESALGGIALVGSSIAALGGFAYFRGRKSHAIA
jgi:hypothetical protein